MVFLSGGSTISPDRIPREISFQNTGDQISGSRFSFDAYIACMGDFVYPIYGTLAEGFRDIAGCGGISAECVLLSDEGSI